MHFKNYPDGSVAVIFSSVETTRLGTEIHHAHTYYDINRQAPMLAKLLKSLQIEVPPFVPPKESLLPFPR